MNRTGRVCVAVLSAVWLGAAAPITLVPHRAIYEVTLKDAGTSGFAAMNGRIVSEVRDTCDSLSLTQRFISDISSSEGPVVRTDAIITMRELKDGGSMDFDSTLAVNAKMMERSTGKATLGPDGRVTLTSEPPSEFPLPADTLLPFTHTREIIAAAQRGERNLTRRVFQPGDKDDLNLVVAAIGKVSANGEAVDGAELLKGQDGWPILLSYYSVSESNETPQYQVQARLFANGISGSMTLINPNFTLDAKLVKLEPLASSCR